MMNDEKSSIDSDDAEILAKFRSLLGKYQNQSKIINTAVAVTSAVDSQSNAIAQEIASDKIPVLTEVVILNPSVTQPQLKRLTPIYQILDAALEDAHIKLDANDRKALAHALEARMSNQAK